MSLLEIRGLSKRFGGLLAVSGVDMTINAGQIIGVIGPNGAGKTTLFNIVSGIDKPDAGHVRLDGSDITGMPLADVARRGLLRTFQRSLPFANMTVLENVLAASYAFEPHGLTQIPKRWLGIGGDKGAAERRAYELLELAGLTAQARLLAGTLPYGDQRRLEIARALMCNPRILMLDEPAAGLSTDETERVIELLRELRKTGLTTVVIEHNLAVTMGLCEFIVVLDHGVKIAEGTPSQIQTNEAVVEAYLGRKRSHARGF
jgi:branched-chain amino acid transport system ATP-binding protein